MHTAGDGIVPARIYISGLIVSSGSHTLMIKGIKNPAAENSLASISIVYNDLAKNSNKGSIQILDYNHIFTTQGATTVPLTDNSGASDRYMPLIGKDATLMTYGKAN
jgi:hypothetical protein